MGLEVDVWLTDPDLVADPALLSAYEALLDPDEQQRYARYLVPRRRNDFLVSRALLRTTLSRYCEVPPAAWRFGSNDFGRPFVLNPSPGGDIRFSLAHTAGLVACAVTRDRDIGVDVERLDRIVDIAGVARTTFAPPEIAGLEHLGGPSQVRSFFSTWTLKEAYAKARGRGMALPFREFWFDRDRSDAICLHIDPTLEPDAGRWDFRQYQTGSGYLLSLAIERAARGGPEVRWRDVVPLIPDREGHV